MREEPLVKFYIYETRARLYVVGRDKSKTRWRILKIDRSEPADLVLVEDPVCYDSRRCKQLLLQLAEGNRACGGLKLMAKAHCIVGFIKFREPYYMVVVRRRAQVGSVCGHAVYKVEESQLITIPHPSVQTDLATSKLEQRYKRLMASVDLTKDFFFSYTYPLMHSLQHNMIAAAAEAATANAEAREEDAAAERRNLASALSAAAAAAALAAAAPGAAEAPAATPLPSNSGKNPSSSCSSGSGSGRSSSSCGTGHSVPFEHIFVWNAFLTRPLRSRIGGSSVRWIVPLVHGFFDQVKLSIFGRIISLTLIARRSRHFAGTRYLKRGVNDKGHVANQVETEQVVVDEDSLLPSQPQLLHASSVVQVRGSIPLFWSQEASSLSPKPDIILHRYDPLYTATRLHFNDLVQRYGEPIIILNLVKTFERRPREMILRREYATAVQYLNKTAGPLKQLRYVHVDFSKLRSKKQSLPTANIPHALEALLAECSDATGIFYTGRRSAILLKRRPPNRNLVQQPDVHLQHEEQQQPQQQQQQQRQQQQQQEDEEEGGQQQPEPAQAVGAVGSGALQCEEETTVQGLATAAGVHAAAAAPEAAGAVARSTGVFSDSGGAFLAVLPSRPDEVVETATAEDENDSAPPFPTVVGEGKAVEQVGAAAGSLQQQAEHQQGQQQQQQPPPLPPQQQQLLQQREEQQQQHQLLREEQPAAAFCPGCEPRLQHGVVRTNCIDCLDRTNEAQFFLAREALARQLHALGVTEDARQRLDPTCGPAEALKSMFVAMGDALALQYGGSAAHNMVFSEKQGQWHAAALQSQELFKSIRRYYSNAITDADKQDALNLFLGHFQPEENKPALWELDNDYHLHVSAPDSPCHSPLPSRSSSGLAPTTPCTSSDSLDLLLQQNLLRVQQDPLPSQQLLQHTPHLQQHQQQQQQVCLMPVPLAPASTTPAQSPHERCKLVSFDKVLPQLNLHKLKAVRAHADGGTQRDAAQRAGEVGGGAVWSGHELVGTLAAPDAFGRGFGTTNGTLRSRSPTPLPPNAPEPASAADPAAAAACGTILGRHQFLLQQQQQQQQQQWQRQKDEQHQRRRRPRTPETSQPVHFSHDLKDKYAAWLHPFYPGKTDDAVLHDAARLTSYPEGGDEDYYRAYVASANAMLEAAPQTIFTEAALDAYPELQYAASALYDEEDWARRQQKVEQWFASTEELADIVHCDAPYALPAVVCQTEIDCWVGQSLLSTSQ